MEELLVFAGVALFLMAFVVYSSFSWGYVLMKFWMWFLLPVFPQLPIVSFYQAVGLMLFINLFKSHTASTIKDEYRKDKKEDMLQAIISPWLILLCGYIIYTIVH